MSFSFKSVEGFYDIALEDVLVWKSQVGIERKFKALKLPTDSVELGIMSILISFTLSTIWCPTEPS